MTMIDHKLIHVTKNKKNTLEHFEAPFLKKKILEIHEIIKAANATSRMTAYRYLKKLDYLTSYTHARQFIPLKPFQNLQLLIKWR